jgi:hypothetical protein
MHGQSVIKILSSSSKPNKCVTILTDMNAGVKPTTETPCICNIRHSVGSVQRNDTVEARLLLHCLSWPVVITGISGMSRNYFSFMETHLADSFSASLSASNTPHRRRWSIKQVWRTWCSTVYWNKGKLWDSLQPSHLGRRTHFPLSLFFKLTNNILCNSLPTGCSYPYFHLIRRTFTCAVERMSLSIRSISNQPILVSHKKEYKYFADNEIKFRLSFL